MYVEKKASQVVCPKFLMGYGEYSPTGITPHAWHHNCTTKSPLGISNTLPPSQGHLCIPVPPIGFTLFPPELPFGLLGWAGMIACT